MDPSHDGSRCVLVIEDDAAIREMLVWALGDEGYAVIAVGDCRRALAYLRANVSPSLILMDYHLPRMSGAELLRVLQRNPRLRDIPVVMMSASLEAERAAKRLGVAAFLSKPFEGDQLIGLVQRLLRKWTLPRRVRIYPCAPRACQAGL